MRGIIEQTARGIRELVALVADSGARPAAAGRQRRGLLLPIVYRWSLITCKSGDSLDNIAEARLYCVVMDPPYYDNVMYAELSDSLCLAQCMPGNAYIL